MATVLGPSPRIDLRIEPPPSASPKPGRESVPRVPDDASAALQSLIAGYRLNGWRAAQLDPLDDGDRDPFAVAELDPRNYGLATDEPTRHPIEFGGGRRILALRELMPRLHASGAQRKQLFALSSATPDAALGKCDLRVHAGMWAQVHSGHGDVRVLLAHNPSHLESVSPVVCGIARALQDRKSGDSHRSVM